MSPVRLRLDPWPAEYESSFLIEELEEQPSAKIDTTVEGIGWHAVEPAKIARPDPLHFVDGVRRVEARIIVEDQSIPTGDPLPIEPIVTETGGKSKVNDGKSGKPNRIVRGLFGSIAVGAVAVEGNAATFETVIVKRYLVIDSGVSLDGQTMRVGNTDLMFQPYSVPENDPLAPITGLQNLMRTAEAALAEELVRDSCCVFADGPLTYFASLKEPTIGVIKRLVEPYLAAAQFDLVRELLPGQRTPLFSITKHKYDRYSWYLRIAPPRAMDHDVAGVLRLEVRSGIGLDKAIELADMSASCIPPFAADSVRDPRSPQNLLPIGSLERELRHRLGDAHAIRRAIEMSLFEMSTA